MRFGSILLFLILFSLPIFATQTLVVYTTVVCTLGDSYYSTIQSAIDDSVDGDTIIVCANGTEPYYENILIEKQINLYGYESGVKLASPDGTGVVKILADNVNFSNFTIETSLNYGESGIWAEGAHLNIDNIDISELLGDDGEIDGYGVLGFASYSNFSHINIHNTDIGYLLSWDSFSTISDGSVYDCRYGVYIQGPMDEHYSRSHKMEAID
ncbi:Uncharacterised protein [Candidatus Bilamarchaeum dharawalense]|uniref:Right handed beta helix domain-containing protein n=1 Tax=Candidatus Bilamarchaeum dharawalense TaxID=2885759 RepID=A0A5E4LMJ4_9ARCH|nr:Uncharacterised protein [Candidatus Bilamarchaeum dharawalense]